MNKNKEQVQLSKLVFTQSWEDPLCDHRALEIRKGDTVVAITSGGCNILGFLLFDPGKIFCLDINPAQSYLLELKIAAMRVLTFDEFQCFSGLTSGFDRMTLFAKVVEQLGPGATSFWASRTAIIENGFIMQGRYDRFVKFAGRVLKVLQGKDRINRLMEKKSEGEQHKFYDEVWDTWQYRAIYKLLFNKHVLARKGLSADYFHFDDGSASFAESFYRRARNAFRNLPIEGNYFLSLYVTGSYADPHQVPDYLKQEYFEIIRSRLDRLNILTTDAQSWLDNQGMEQIDCFALSNICELMSEDETNRLFEAVGRIASHRARVIFRNLIIPREVPHYLNNTIVKNEQLSRELLSSDRSFVYGKVAAYSVVKG
ncbi:DUF3419 family protein [Robiginitalea sp. SC105]|uniref:DUF3419 family protein n=1 Tax=Robiginitalea sp. SC105 TaxID=2762332 RepID=UPI00163AEBEF|nr:DUF3419 family protein [Robiginitalea sp. SC105]MBC2838995.1 DUF3419 family protein [Robiginitalea sp. SC105]